jgi:hypothetical protein
MKIWQKLTVVAALPLALTGCLWGPGKFGSNLALNRAGTFVLDYRGEILLQIPEEKAVLYQWDDSMVRCHKDGRIERRANPSEPESEDDIRPCTAEEIAREKAEHQKEEADRVAKNAEELEQMATMFGLPTMDDESNRRFAANLMKHAGWRSVTYKGKGVFDVDYHFEGRLTQDFVFPMMPDSDFLIPFVILRRRNDGSVMVTAPALTGGSGPFSARAKAMGLPDKGADGPVSRAQGRFTITTDGEILTNNSEDGPTAAPNGRQVHWDVGPGSAKVPEMLVRL